MAKRSRILNDEGSYVRLIDFVSLNSRLESNKEEEAYIKHLMWGQVVAAAAVAQQARRGVRVHGYLAHKKHPPPRTLQ